MNRNPTGNTDSKSIPRFSSNCLCPSANLLIVYGQAQRTATSSSSPTFTKLQMMLIFLSQERSEYVKPKTIVPSSKLRKTEVVKFLTTPLCLGNLRIFGIISALVPGSQSMLDTSDILRSSLSKVNTTAFHFVTYFNEVCRISQVLWPAHFWTWIKAFNTASKVKECHHSQLTFTILPFTLLPNLKASS